MKANKLNTITNLFESSEIRSVWDTEKEDYYFSVVDVIRALTNSTNPRNYWNMLKKRMNEEGCDLYTFCVQLKMKSTKDGKNYVTDALNTEGIFRLIESIPSPKAEPFKLWLASLGSERIDEVFYPELVIKRSITYYKNRGYDDKWIEARIKAILSRNKLTDVWRESGITENYEYAILTNEKDTLKLKEYVDKNLKDNYKIYDIIIVDELPKTTAGKINFNLIEKYDFANNEPAKPKYMEVKKLMLFK